MKYVYLLVEQSNIGCEGYYGPSIQDVTVTAYETREAAKKALREARSAIKSEYPGYETTSEANGESFYTEDPDSDNFYSAEITRTEVK